MIGVLFSLPTAADAIAAIGAWSSPLVNEFLPLIYIFIAIAILVIILRLFTQHRG